VTADGGTFDGGVIVNGAGINLDNAFGLSWGDGSAQIRGSGTSEAVELLTSSVVRLKADADGDVSFYNSAGTSQDLFWDASTSRLGIGETNPSAQLHIKGNANANMILEAGSTTDANFIYFGDSAGLFRGGFKYDHSADSLGIYANGLTTPDVTLDSSGNLLVGGDVTPASSQGNLALFNGVVPTGSVTDGIVLYAEDVSSSSELKVRDEAGNITTLSPHNFDLIPEGPSEDMAWAYFSEKDGKRINVDMLKAIRLLERISGEKLVFEN